MNKDFWKDYLSCTALKLIGPLIRLLPFRISMRLGRAVGELMYWFDFKHRAIAYANIKRALGAELSPRELKKTTRNFFRAFGQNIIDIFLIPLIGKKHMDKYLEIEGRGNIAAAFKKGKGVIFLAVHAGSWELSNVICANLGFPFRMFVRSQNMPRLNKLLNSYRQQNGCRIFERDDHGQLRELIKTLKDNEATGMTIDQGGRSGMLIDFFGKNASMSSGAIKLALKYDAAILPSSYARKNGAYYKLVIDPPFELKKTGDPDADVKNNLQALVKLFEGHIRQYPAEYLWTYKIWKYSNTRDILVLSDGKAGHLRQSEAAAKAIVDCLRQRGITARVKTLEVKISGKFGRSCLALCGMFSGKYSCQGCLACLRRFIPKESYGSLVREAADIVISCGSSLAGINHFIARENRARSVVIMRPAFLGLRRFDLAIIPRHDRPPKRKNVAVTEGALNLIDAGYLKEQAEKLTQAPGFSRQASGLNIGVLIGGDAKNFHLDPGVVKTVISQIKSFAQEESAALLVTTSRRSGPEIEALVKSELGNYAACKFLVIAGENNPEFSVGGILGLSDIVVVSPESISMVSEAASSGKYVIAFDAQVSRRHRRFLSGLAEKKYIYLQPAQELSSLMSRIKSQRPEIKILNDRDSLKEAIGRII